MIKRQIKKAIEAKNQELSALRAIIKDVESTNGTTLESIEDWNGLYDSEYNLEQEIRSLDLDMGRCGWGAQDYTMSNMIAMNID